MCAWLAHFHSLLLRSSRHRRLIEFYLQKSRAAIGKQANVYRTGFVFEDQDLISILGVEPQVDQFKTVFCNVVVAVNRLFERNAVRHFQGLDYIPIFSLEDNTVDDKRKFNLLLCKRRHPKPSPTTKSFVTEAKTLPVDLYLSQQPLSEEMLSLYLTSSATTAQHSTFFLKRAFVPPMSVFVPSSCRSHASLPLPAIPPTPSEDEISSDSDDEVNLKDFLKSACESDLFILGSPGIGKSVFLKYLAGFLTEKPPVPLNGIPILVELGALFQVYGGSLSDFLHARYPASSDFLFEVLKQNNGVLLLDGLDEVWGLQEGVLEFIDYRTGTNRVLITSRSDTIPLQYSGRIFRRCRIGSFGPVQIHQFIEQAIPNRHQQEKTRKYLSGNGPLEQLAATPLFLAFICMLFQDPGGTEDVPIRIGPLYEKISDLLMRRMNEDMKDQPQRCVVPSQRKRAFLETLSFDLFLSKKNIISDSELRSQIEAFSYSPERPLGFKIEEMDNALKEITIHNGFLTKMGKFDFQFIHSTFQDFFVASLLKRRELWRLELTDERLLSPRWELLIRMLCGLVEEGSAILHHIWKSEIDKDGKDDIFHSRMLLSGKCSFEAIGNVSGIKKQLLDALLRIDPVLLLCKGSEVETALSCLTVAHQEWIQSLFDALPVESKGGTIEKFRWKVLLQLLKRSYPPACLQVLLLFRMVGESQARIREVLSNIFPGSEPLCRPLLRILFREDRSKSFWSIALRSLASMVDYTRHAFTDSIARKEGWIERNSNKLRRKAVRLLLELGLGEDEYPESAEAAQQLLSSLIAELHNRPTEFVSAFLEAVFHIGVVPGADVSVIFHLLQQPRYSKMALFALTGFPAKEATELLLDILETNGCLLRTYQVYTALKFVDRPTVKCKLEACPKNWLTNAFTIRSLGLFGVESATDSLAEACKTPDGNLSNDAVVGLGLLGGSDAVAQIELIYRDFGRPYLRDTGIVYGALALSEEGARVLCKLLTEEKHFMERDLIVRSLSYAKTHWRVDVGAWMKADQHKLERYTFLDQVHSWCRSSKDLDRAMAMLLLNLIGPDRSMDVLVSTIACERDREIRTSMKYAIAGSHSRDAEPYCLTFLQEKDVGIRRAAIGYFVRNPSEASVASLLRLALKDLSDCPKYPAAFAAIESAGSTDAIGPLLQVIGRAVPELSGKVGVWLKQIRDLEARRNQLKQRGISRTTKVWPPTAVYAGIALEAILRKRGIALLRSGQVIPIE